MGRVDEVSAALKTLGLEVEGLRIDRGDDGLRVSAKLTLAGRTWDLATTFDNDLSVNPADIGSIMFSHVRRAASEKAPAEEKPAPCGGCIGQGSHRRFCQAVNGPNAARFYKLSQEADNLADMTGSNEPGAANHLYSAASNLLDRARREADAWRGAQR